MLLDALENRLLDASLGRFGWSGKPSTLHFGLLTAGPQNDAGLNAVEVSRTGTGYARVPLQVASGSWTADDVTGDLVNAAALNWPLAGADWGSVTHIGIYSAATGGTLFGAVELSQPETIARFNTFSIPAGQVALRLRGALSVPHRLDLWNWFARGTALPAVPRVFFALGNGVIDSGLVGELDNTYGYERTAINNSQANFPAASAGRKNLSTTQLSRLASTAPSMPWPQASHIGIYDRKGVSVVNAIGPTANTLVTLDDHFFANSNRIVFLRQDNAVTATNGITPHLIYFVREATPLTYRISATDGGAAVTLTATSGTPFTTISALRAFLVSDSTINSSAAVSGDAFIPFTAPVPLAVGDRVHFNASSAPTNFTNNRVLWVVGRVGDGVALSETEGGAALSPGSTGSGIVLRKIETGRLLYSAQLATPLLVSPGASAIFPGGEGGLDFTLD
jgi:hypothetical protein